MDILELYDLLLDNNIDLDLVGEITYDNSGFIKWEYDGLGKTEKGMEEHLEDVFEADREIIEDFLADKKIDNYFMINQPNFDESYAFFHLTEE